MDVKQIILAMTLGGGCMFSAASDLSKQGKFEALYGSEIQTASTQTISELVASLVDSSDDEKFNAVNAYIQANDLSLSRFTNLVEALQVLNLQPLTTDKLVALYAGKREGKFKLETTVALLSMISRGGYSSSTPGNNQAVAVARVFIQNSRVPYDAFRFLIKHLNSKGVNPFLRDSLLLVEYVKVNGGAMEVGEIKDLISWLDGNHVSVQHEGVMTDLFVRLNATKLTQPEFRQAVERMKSQVPQGEGLHKLPTLPPEVQERYLYTEKMYFSSMFFNTGSLVKVWTAEIPVDHHQVLVDLFISRNQHRMKNGQIDKLRSAF